MLSPQGRRYGGMHPYTQDELILAALQGHEFSDRKSFFSRMNISKRCLCIRKRNFLLSFNLWQKRFCVNYHSDTGCRVILFFGIHRQKDLG
jgi:hypothetical protein